MQPPSAPTLFLEAWVTRGYYILNSKQHWGAKTSYKKVWRSNVIRGYYNLKRQTGLGVGGENSYKKVWRSNAIREYYILKRLGAQGEPVIRIKNMWRSSGIRRRYILKRQTTLGGNNSCKQMWRSNDISRDTTFLTRLAILGYQEFE